MKDQLYEKETFRSNNSGKVSVTVKVIDSLNKTQSEMDKKELKDLRPRNNKLLITDKCIECY